MICVGESAGPRSELFHCLVDGGGPDGLVQVEVVVGTGQLGVADRVAGHRAYPLDEGLYIRRWYQVFLAVDDEHGRRFRAERRYACVFVAGPRWMSR
jgi:hypothetical protein